MRILRLVVDNDRPGLPSAFYDAAAVVARIREETAPRVLAFRATKGGQDWRPRRGATGGEVGDDPRVSVRNSVEPARASDAAFNRERSDISPAGAAHPSVPSSPWSSGRWLLAVPYVVAAIAAAAGYGLAYLFGGVR